MTKPKTLAPLPVAATLGLAAVAAPQPAEAGHGGAVAAGVIGGLAVGAIIGATAASGPYYGYGPGYYYADPAYYSYGYGGLLLDPSAVLGRLGLAHSTRTSLRLEVQPRRAK